VAKVGTSKPDRTISLEGCGAYVENNNKYVVRESETSDVGRDLSRVRISHKAPCHILRMVPDSLY
jgi:hypothetical protein